jgi:tRNA A-37 threonylcarbamoyl transferase component Bud32
MEEHQTFQKNDVSPKEAAMQLLLSTGILKGQTPTVHSYDAINGILIMDKINEMCVSDMYGEHMADVPKEIVDQIRRIIKVLYENHIEYPDITGYNFIYTEDEKDGKVYIIDMEHARYNYGVTTYDPYILRFIKGDSTEWNERFM